MIDNRNRRIRIGDKIYHIYWEPINGEPTWLVVEYVIKDMYYSDNCYALIENTANGKICELILNHGKLINWFYTEQEAREACKKEQSTPQSYAWGNSIYRDNDRHSNSSCDVTGIPSIVETDEVETPMYCEKSIKERESFLKNLHNLSKAFKEVFK